MMKEEKKSWQLIHLEKNTIKRISWFEAYPIDRQESLGLHVIILSFILRNNTIKIGLAL